MWGCYHYMIWWGGYVHSIVRVGQDKQSEILAVLNVFILCTVLNEETRPAVGFHDYC